MNHFIKNIHVNNLFHLRNFDIPIEDEKTPHLIITGKNGSGKTILLNAIAEFLENIKNDNTLNFTKYEEYRDIFAKRLNSELKDPKDLMEVKNSLNYYQSRIDETFGKVKLDFVNVAALISDYQEGDFIITFYQAARNPQMVEPVNPEKPQYKLNGNVKDTATSQFLKFLSDLKIQEALARNENQMKDADHIRQWFVDFENLLRQIYQDNKLNLTFNYKDYSFHIQIGEKIFKFTELSDGFAAILDIVADLILKMQTKDSLTRAYQKKGIVLIDEVETHLHLELQKIVLPILTKVFPNIQFIITTHSPFVLSSLENAVAFDLEHQEIINELTQYSYEALAEGYFGVKTDSSYMEMRLEALKQLLEKSCLTDVEKAEAQNMIADFENIPEAVSPLLVGEFMQLKIKYSDTFNSLKK